MDQPALPLGFRFGATRAGLKASGNPDLACAVADTPAAAAAMFTSNRVCAAPLIVGRRHLHASRGRVRAVVVNAGNANCATGDRGIDHCIEVCHASAALLGCDPHAIFPSSTGIIGVPLPADRVVAALPALHGSLGATPAHLQAFAEAIMTTDTRPKLGYATVTATEGRAVHLAGVAKGAGMIAPALTGAAIAPHATMLAYLFTDLAATPAELAALLTPAVETSFNRISIDGDTSTNDTVLLLASGESRVPLAHVREPFADALQQLSVSLARQIVADGEGATHLVELEITGAPNDADALQIARTVANSPLVKTAWAGNDPNWGRLLAAAGRSGAPIDHAKIAVWFGSLPICEGGLRAPAWDESAAHAYLSQREFTVRLSVGDGPGFCRFWTTDLTAEYVRINADYST